MSKIQKNQTVYDSKGVEAIYIQELSDGQHLVAVPMFDNEGECGEKTQIWRKALLEIPKPRLAEDLLSVRKAIDEKIKIRDEIHHEIHNKKIELSDIDSTILKRKDILSQHKSLENLELFIQGKITHFIFINSGRYEIKEFAESMRFSDIYDRNRFKLLTLYGDSNGELEWGINEYPNDCGKLQLVYPCLSKEDAESKVIEIYHKLLSKLNPEKLDYTFTNTVNSAMELGITLDEVITIAYNKNKAEARNENIRLINRQIGELKKQLQIKENNLSELTKEVL